MHEHFALSSNRNAKQLILIRYKHSQRAARSFVRGLEIRLNSRLSKCSSFKKGNLLFPQCLGNGGSCARGSSAPEHNSNLQETDFARNFPRLCGERTPTSQSKRFLYFCVISSHVTKHGSHFPCFVQTQSEFRGKFLFYSSFHGNHIIRRDLVVPNSNGAFHQVYQSLLQILINV